MDKKLFDILACPVCKGSLEYWRGREVLVCRFDRLAYPITDGIPMMLEDEAERLTLEDVEAGDRGPRG